MLTKFRFNEELYREYYKLKVIDKAPTTYMKQIAINRLEAEIKHIREYLGFIKI